MPQKVLEFADVTCMLNELEEGIIYINLDFMRLISFRLSIEFVLVSIKYCLCYERIKNSP